MSAQQRPIADRACHQDFDRIQRQIAHRAKRLAVTARVLARWRGGGGWRQARSYRLILLDHASRLHFERRTELEALLVEEGREEVGRGIPSISR
jgi:hypothetical protein